MTVSASIQRIISAKHDHYKGLHHAPFDAVKIISEAGGYIDLYLPAGTGLAVADAINAAVARDVQEAAE